METTNDKTIRYPASVDERFEKVARKLGRTKKQLFIQMVDYFYKSKKDPGDLNDEALKKELSSGINRIISFIRQQEHDLLAPILTGTGEIHAMVMAYRKELETVGNRQNESLANDAESLKWFNAIGSLLKKIHDRQAEKESLKQKFGQILRYYINQREALGWPVSAAKKEELARHAKQSLDNL